MFKTLDRWLPYTFLDNSPGNWLLFLLFLSGGILLRRLFSFVLLYVLYHFMPKKKELSRLPDFIAKLRGPVGFFILLIFTYLAFLQLQYPSSWGRYLGNKLNIQTLLTDFYLIVLIASCTLILIRLIDFLSELFLQKAGRTESKFDDHLIPYLKELFKVGAVLLSFLFILGLVFQINIATLIAGLGIGGLAIAYAGKETLENMLASFTIFLDRPFVAGDLIQIDDIIGRVEKVGFRSTRIRTLERSLLTLPNRMLVDRPLDNWNERKFWRARFNIVLTYDTPVENLRKIKDEILNYLQQHPKTNADNKVYFTEYGDNGYHLTVFLFAITNNFFEFHEIKEEVNFKIREIVEQNGSSFAFPTRTVHLPEIADLKNIQAK